MRFACLIKPLVLMACCVLASAAGIASGDESSPRVVIKDFEFIPRDITVKVGQTVVWENQEKRQFHSIWFEASGEDESEYLFPEESYEKTFDTPGKFSYRCGPHPEMIGSVTVVE